ncbi:MAG: hypothetical protein N3G78_10260 [Desulfobacterota bacterium]|nr:hypothetical protein [Thermodesulfobacteriota bacterium]
MKVKTIDPSLTPGGSHRPHRREQVQGLDFAQMLIHAKERLNGAGPINPADPLSLRSKSLQSIEETLTTIELYQEGLSSPETPLRGIEPIVQSMARGVEELDGLSRQLPLDDPLRKIMIETAILSAVEIEKFRRGDYL